MTTFHEHELVVTNYYCRDSSLVVGFRFCKMNFTGGNIGGTVWTLDCLLSYARKALPAAFVTQDNGYIKMKGCE